MVPTSAPENPGSEIYTVSRLNREVRHLLEEGISTLWLEAEISNFVRPASGHLYFSLKDENAQVRCAFFRNAQRRGLTIEPENGLLVRVRARVGLYEARGEYQLIVDRLEAAGVGALHLAFEQLKAKLLKEGLFDSSHKHPLPALPRRIGVITSPSGAVWHDIVTTLGRRFPAIAVLLYPVPVQGEGAAETIATMIKLASKRQECEALILARGGGSIEDLWAFNEEPVARAIHACRIPLVCAVGHETDVTIADWVADVRAPTPTAAAELLSPDQHELRTRLRQQFTMLYRQWGGYLDETRQNLDWLTARLVHPHDRIQQLQERLQLSAQRLIRELRTRIREQGLVVMAITGRLRQASPSRHIQIMRAQYYRLAQFTHRQIIHRLDRQRQHLHALAGRLHTLSPLATLDRGYAILTRSLTGEIIRDARTVQTGDAVDARLPQGRLKCIVEDVNETN